MTINLRSHRSIVPDKAPDDAFERDDLTRRDGSIRGVILNTTLVNFDRVFGLTKPTEDFSL